MFGNIATSKLLQIRKLPELELGIIHKNKKMHDTNGKLL